MKTSQPVTRLPFAAAAALVAGLLTGALWPGQPTPIDTAIFRHQPTTVDYAIPSITFTAKRMSPAEKASVAHAEIDPTVPYLTVIGYRDRATETLARPL